MTTLQTCFAGSPAAPRSERIRWVLTRIKLWRCRQVGSGARAVGTIWVHGGGAVIIGRNVLLDGRLAPIEIHARTGAAIVLGDNVTVQGGASIEATERVTVAAGSVLGPFVKIIDSHFHPLRGDRHLRPQAQQVRIEEHVLIEAGAIVLPGAHVQAGARIGAGSVISHRVPPGAFVSGNPPRAVRKPAGVP